MKVFMFVFPVIFILFAVFYGFISYSVLIKKKPVIMSSKWLILLIGLGFLPSIVINFIVFLVSNQESIIQLSVSAVLILLFVFYTYIIRGVSIYGITDDDFKKYLFQTLTNKGTKFTEELNKIHLDEIDTDINISFQEWMGTGMIKMKDSKKFDFKSFIIDLRKNINSNSIETKKVTAFFYILFSVLMIITSISFVYVFSRS